MLCFQKKNKCVLEFLDCEDSKVHGLKRSNLVMGIEDDLIGCYLCRAFVMVPMMLILLLQLVLAPCFAMILAHIRELEEEVKISNILDPDAEKKKPLDKSCKTGQTSPQGRKCHFTLSFIRI
ncbi:hypothetical protein HanPSC8_Chr10g0432041 [Helianthus annuus]|nr:hypothetical protein HanPSC8_Chr10g0432041 [Helianthus annuus]